MGSLFSSKPRVTQATDPIAQSAFNMYQDALRPIQGGLQDKVLNALANPVYGGQTYAGLDPMQQQYYNMAGTIGNLGLNAAQNTMGGAQGNYDATKDYGTRIAAFGGLLQNPNAAFDMGSALANSPMANSMIDAGARDVQRNLGMDLAGLERGFVGGGNTNNNRAGLETGMLKSRAAENIMDLGSQVRSSLFNQGVGQYNNNINQQSNALNQLMNANNNAFTTMNSAYGLGSGALNDMGAAGNFMRLFNQGAMDDAANKFYMGQDRPLQLAGNYMQLFNPLGGFSGSAGYSGAQSQPSTLDKFGQVANIVGTGMTLFCWVAREVYGPYNYRWRMFRHWMYFDSPRWLHSAYAKYGERFAVFIANKPKLKRVIRYFMDKAIKQYGGPHGAI